MLRVALCSFLAVSFASLSGCTKSGPEVNHVEGRVTVGGQPLSGATVTFSPAEGSTGRAATGRTDANGVYTLTDMQSDEIGSGAAVGKYLVSISKIDASGAEQFEQSGSDESYTASATEPMKIKSEIPERYNRPDTSGLTATVESGRNEINFELEAS